MTISLIDQFNSVALILCFHFLTENSIYLSCNLFFFSFCQLYYLLAIYFAISLCLSFCQTFWLFICLIFYCFYLWMCFRSYFISFFWFVWHSVYLFKVSIPCHWSPWKILDWQPNPKMWLSDRLCKHHMDRKQHLHNSKLNKSITPKGFNRLTTHPIIFVLVKKTCFNEALFREQYHQKMS